MKSNSFKGQLFQFLDLPSIACLSSPLREHFLPRNVGDYPLEDRPDDFPLSPLLLSPEPKLCLVQNETSLKVSSVNDDSDVAHVIAYYFSTTIPSVFFPLSSSFPFFSPSSLINSAVGRERVTLEWEVRL